MKIYTKKTDALEQNLIAMHTIIWGQASPTMQIKVKSVKGLTLKPTHMIACGCYNKSRQSQ